MIVSQLLQFIGSVYRFVVPICRSFVKSYTHYIRVHYNDHDNSADEEGDMTTLTHIDAVSGICCSGQAMDRGCSQTKWKCTLHRVN